MEYRLKLLPKEQIDSATSPVTLDRFERNQSGCHYLISDRKALFFNRGRDGIEYLARKLGLKREDEVYISTTSDSPYVSSCVTCTFFNFCKVSRVISNKTKLIWIIHEFGFVNLQMKKLIQIGKERNIPVAEDTAHSMYSYYDGRLLGQFGDYALYSLPKTLPVGHGGILTGHDLEPGIKPWDKDVHDRISGDFYKYSPYIQAISERRKDIYLRYRRAMGHQTEIYRYSDESSPFVYFFKTYKSEKILNLMLNEERESIEFALTHNPNWVGLPTNAFARDESIDKTIETVKTIMDV